MWTATIGKATGGVLQPGCALLPLEAVQQFIALLSACMCASDSCTSCICCLRPTLTTDASYVVMSGTSMATPLVTATAAMVASVLGASSGVYRQADVLKTILMSTGEPQLFAQQLILPVLFGAASKQQPCFL